MGELREPRVLRALSATDAPVAGLLVAGDPPVVWTDAAAWEGLPAWRAAPDGHVLAPVDAGRTADGPALLVPHCPERLAESLLRRTDLTEGEAVTVAVSLLRGGAEADRLAAAHGRWWVTADGRPVVALGGGLPWREEIGPLIEALADGQRAEFAAVLARVADALLDADALGRESAACEDALFAAAAPRPLGAEPGPVRARRLDVTRGEREDIREPQGLRALLARHVDAEIADRVHAVWRRVREGRPIRPREERKERQLREHGPTRRRPVVVAAVVAGAIVLVGGLLWPTEDSAVDASSPAAVDSTPAADDRSVTTTPTVSPTAEAGQQPDLAAVGADLLRALAACPDDTCRRTAQEDPSRPLPEGAATAPTADVEISLVDEYGGVAVLRATDATGALAPQIVVIVRTGTEWVVRDVYDAGDHP